MANNIDLDLEIIEVGTSYTLYACSLTNLAISLNEGNDTKTACQDVSSYAKQLRDVLFRCGIDKDIKENFGNSDEIIRLIDGKELANEICNLLARHHQRLG